MLIKKIYISEFLRFQRLNYEIKNSKIFDFMDRPGAVNEKIFTVTKFFIFLIFFNFMDRAGAVNKKLKKINLQ